MTERTHIQTKGGQWPGLYSVARKCRTWVVALVLLFQAGFVVSGIAADGAGAGVVRGGTKEYSKGATGAATLPQSAKKLSELNGWRGLTLKTGLYGRMATCSLKMPARFGLRNDPERLALVKLTNTDDPLVDDIGCDNHGYSWEALEQLFVLATRFQDPRAARLFVMRGGLAELGLTRNGELGETYSIEYRWTVLRTFRDLKSIVTPEDETALVTEVCYFAFYLPEAIGGSDGVTDLTKSLQRRGMAPLAQRMTRECGAYAD